MSVIKRLPQYVINKLKAWEIVERPSSVIKELVENSLDAGATELLIEIQKWGKQLMRVTDNGKGMSREDLQLSIERYATSKIQDIDDLETIGSYWFRGEALASISEVSVFRIQTKKKQETRNKNPENDKGPRSSEGDIDNLWYELYRDGRHFQIKPIPFDRDHGTTIYIQDLFHNIPVRSKFLKTDATEWTYIKQMFLNYAIVHRDKKWTLIKDGKTLYQYAPHQSLAERLLEITKSDWEKNLREIAYQDEKVQMFWSVWDASLHFSTPQYMRLFVNWRPVQDRLIKRAVMQAYQRQIVPWSYPFACVFLEVDPRIVDVNVHPRKSEVKFLDPGSMFTRIKETIYTAISDQKVNYAAFTKKAVQPSTQQNLQSNTSASIWPQKTIQQVWSYRWWGMQKKFFQRTSTGLTDGELQQLKNVGKSRREAALFGVHDVEQVHIWHSHLEEVELEWQIYTLVWQVRNSFILLESETDLVYVDQHALAERIAFEKMRQVVSKEWFVSEVLLTPLKVVPPRDIDLDEKLKQLTSIWIDISPFGEQSLLVYAIPRVFAHWKIDTELVLNRVWGSDDQEKTGNEFFQLLLDEVIWMKACKASIKAWQHLSWKEMKQLIEDGLAYIDGMFVCQHGRPSVVRVSKENIEGLFERH